MMFDGYSYIAVFYFLSMFQHHCDSVFEDLLANETALRLRPLLMAEVCAVEEKDNMTLIPGRHFFDAVSCQIYYCRKSIIRYAEVDKYTCKRVAEDPEVYEVFFKECTDKKCLPEPQT